MMIFRLFLGIFLIFILVAFSVKNMTPVVIDLYFYKTPSVPLFVVMFISLLVGIVIAWIMVIGEQLHLRREIKKRNNKIKELEAKVSSLEQMLEQKENKDEVEKSENNNARGGDIDG